jgi:hypothetical protein
MKSSYPVRVPPCPGCSNPENCGACYQKLSTEDRQKLRAGRSPERRSAVLKAVQAPREAFSRGCAWVEDGTPCPNSLPYPGAKGHGHLCDVHVTAELALHRARPA